MNDKFYQEKIKYNNGTFFICINKINKEEIKFNIKNNENYPLLEYELKINICELKKKHKFFTYFPDIDLFISFIKEKKNISIKEYNEKELELLIKSTIENLENVEIIIPKKPLNTEIIIPSLIEKILNLEEKINTLTKNLEESNKIISELKKENINLKSELNKKVNFIRYDKLKEEEKQINQILLFPNGNFAIVTLTRKIIFYNGKNHKSILSINNAHEESITNICLIDENHFITCSRDKSIKIWYINIPTYFLIHQIKKAHKDRILCIIYTKDKKLISSSSDKTIKIWSDINKNFLFQNICIIIADTNYVESLIELNNNIIVSGGNNGIKFWNSKTYECKFHFDKAYCLCWNSLFKINNDEVLTWGKIEMKIYKISYSKKKIINENICDSNLKAIFVNSDGFVFTGCDDMKIRIYLIDNLQLINVISVEKILNVYDEDDNLLSSRILGFVELYDKSIIVFGRACENEILFKDKFELKTIIN